MILRPADVEIEHISIWIRNRFMEKENHNNIFSMITGLIIIIIMLMYRNLNLLYVYIYI